MRALSRALCRAPAGSCAATWAKTRKASSPWPTSTATRCCTGCASGPPPYVPIGMAMSAEETTAEQVSAPAVGLPDPYEVVPSAAFDHAVGIATALVGACGERDAVVAGRLCAHAGHAHGVDGVFTT